MAKGRALCKVGAMHRAFLLITILLLTACTSSMDKHDTQMAAYTQGLTDGALAAFKGGRVPIHPPVGS